MNLLWNGLVLAALSLSAVGFVRPDSPVGKDGPAALAAQDQGGKDIVDTAVGAGRFQTLAAALGAAGLVDTLKGEGPFTVFAPTDEAFARLPEGTVQELLKPENRDRLTAILTYHVVAGKVLAKDALAASEATTLQGDTVSVRLVDGGLRINEARVTANDLECSNGVIHVIDQVLLPPEDDENKLIGIYPESPNSKQRTLLGLERGEGIRINGVVDDGGAEAAGLKRHDIILAINGQRATSEVLDEAKRRTPVGETIELVIARTVQVQTQRGH